MRRWRLPLDPLAKSVRDVTRDLVEERPTLVRKPYRKPKKPLSGTCYLAAETYWHLADAAGGTLHPMLLKDEDWDRIGTSRTGTETGWIRRTSKWDRSIADYSRMQTASLGRS
jgi:hypothetical protein